MGNIPLGTHFSDGLRTAPALTGPIPQSFFPFLPSTSASYSSYDAYGPGILYSIQNTWNITPQPAALNNLVGVSNPGGAGNLTLLGDNAATKYIAGPQPYVQFDWPRVPTVTITNTVAARRITIFGTDWYGFSMQHTYVVATAGTYPAITVGNLASNGLSIPAKAFYTVDEVYIDGALGGGTISLGVADIFGLPFLVSDAGNITSIGWGFQSDLSSNSSILSAPTIGTSTLVAGTVLINSPVLTANSSIQLSVNTPGGTLGFLASSARNPGENFSIASFNADGSANVADTSIVDWEVVNPNGQYSSIGNRISLPAANPNSVTIYTSQIQAGDIVQLTLETWGTRHLNSAWHVSAIVPGESFTVTSADTTETSNFYFSITPSNFPSGTSAVMAAGTVFVPTPYVTANSVIMLTYNTPGGTTGLLSAPVAQIQPGVGFTIVSSSNTDTSTVNWTIERLAPAISMGTATLVAGTVLINTTAAVTGCTIILGYNTFAGAPNSANGYLIASNITNGVSFRATAAANGATVVADTSTINWAIFPPGYSLPQFVTPLGAFIPADQTFPPSATTGDVRGLYAPSTPSDGESVLAFTAYIAGADAWINQVSNQQFINSSNNIPVVGTAIAPLTPQDRVGLPQFYTGTNS